MGGVRMMRGVALAFPPGGIVIHGDSQRLEVKQFNLRLNLATDWLEVALEQLEVSRTAHGKWLAMHKLGGEIDDLFRREFKSAMQATVAAATFFEALYAAVRSTLPARLHAQLASGRGKSRRSALVAEQLKRAFGLRTRGSANVASVITEIYRFRDEAVHPSSAFEPPAIHPDLDQYVEKRLAMFTFQNAKLIVRAALAYAQILPTIGLKQGPRECHELSKQLLSTCGPLFVHWENEYGQLLDPAE